MSEYKDPYDDDPDDTPYTTAVESPTSEAKDFEQLAMEHIDDVYDSALRLTKNHQDADDLVQEAFLRAYRFFDGYRQGTNFRAWVFRILMNTFINGYRRKKRRPDNVDFEKVEFMIPSDSATNKAEYFSDSVVDNEGDIFPDEINDALGRLSDEFRMVVLLADLQDFRYKEIAEIMDCPIGTVMSRLSRARKQLQPYLRDYAVHEGYISK